MALTPLQQIRLIIQDNTPGLYIISDDELQYFLEKNNDNITRASMDAAKVVLLNLSMRGDESVDIFSIRGSKQASEYRLSLQMFLRDPNTNPYIQDVKGYVGGVSKSDMQSNNSTFDNNVVTNPYTENCSSFPLDYFKV